MYGTRDAAQNWETTYTEVLEAMGFVTGKAVTCAFAHHARNLRAVVHGDDFVVLGHDEDVTWFNTQMNATFETKSSTIGPGPSHDKYMRLLNRVITWSDEGITIEGDQRHAELIVKSFGMSATSRGLATPIESDRHPELNEELDARQAT